MSEMFFAYQKPTDEQISAIVEQLYVQARPPAWALIDMALLTPEQRDSLNRQARWGMPFNAFKATSLEAFGDQAPHLLELPADTQPLRNALLYLFRLAGDAPAISLLRGVDSQVPLQHTFAYMAKVRIEQRKAPVHCRFADTRVLPELLGCLTTSQRLRIAFAIQSWYWPTREGALAAWQGAIGATEIKMRDDSSTLQLSVKQFRRMQHAAEPDSIFLMLCQQTPELVPAVARGAFHAKLMRMLATAEALGIKEIKDKLQFVVLSLTCGEDFHAVQALQPTWVKVAEGGHLHLLMQAWSDALWEQLDACDGKTG